MYELTPIEGCDDPDREGDVVFVHGASAEAEMPWHPPGQPEMSFPQLLGEDVPSIGSWSLNYQMSFRRWEARSMPLKSQGLNTLSELVSKGFGKRPIVFIAHSVGGLVVKHLLQSAFKEKDNNAQWASILDQTKGVVFLSTPHFGVRLPWIARVIPFLLQPIAREVAKGNRDLMTLNDSFQDIFRLEDIEVEVYYEQQRTRHMALIDEDTADPNLPGVTAIPVNTDHDGICQPRSRGGLPYYGVCVFVRRRCAPVEFQDDATESDVFLSHNSHDKQAVRKLALALRRRGLKVWLDQWALVPGDHSQEGLEKGIAGAKSAAVLIGKDGLGPWEEQEMRACLNEHVARGLPVIPVLLPGAASKPELPLFLKDLNWVELSEPFTEAELDRLQWGITRVNPGHAS